MLLPTFPVGQLSETEQGNIQTHLCTGPVVCAADAMLHTTCAFHTTFFFIPCLFFSMAAILSLGPQCCWQCYFVLECLLACVVLTSGLCAIAAVRAAPPFEAWQYLKLSCWAAASHHSPYSMSYRYRAQFLWISVFILLYCEHIFFLAALFPKKVLSLHWRSVRSLVAMTAASRTRCSTQFCSPRAILYIRTSSSQPHH